jgi:hypothetical protein
MKYKEVILTMKVPIMQEDDELDLVAAFKNADIQEAMGNLEFGTKTERDGLDVQDGVEIIKVEHA